MKAKSTGVGLFMDTYISMAFVTVNNGHTMAQTEFHKYTTVNKSCTNFLRDTTEN